MKKILVIMIIFILLTAGCEYNAPVLIDEPIETFEVARATIEPTINETPAPEKSTEEDDVIDTDGATLDEKLAKIEFFMVSGYFCRNVLEEDTTITEMFSFDKNSFVRIATSELEREVYAYNYLSDDFTYIYYFDGDLVSKTVFNIDTGAILEDSDGYAELLKADADELKKYFYELMDISGFSLDELR